MTENLKQNTVASSKTNILNDIFGDLDNDTLAADLISSKIKPKSGNSRPKFNSSSFQKPRTIQPTIPASKVKPLPDSKTVNANTDNQKPTDDSRINDSNDFSDEFDDDFAFATPTTTTNIDIGKEDTNRYDHRALSTQKMNLVEKYAKYNSCPNPKESKSEEVEVQAAEEITEKNEFNDSTNSIDSDPPSPIITQSKHRIEISSESENDASQEKINPASFIVKQEPTDDPQGAAHVKSVTSSSGFFSTASGSSVKISEEAKAKATQNWNPKSDGPSSVKSICATGLGKKYEISDDSISKSKNLFNSNKQSNGNASSGFFSTARGGQVTIDANALAQSKSLFEISTDAIPPMDSSGGPSMLKTKIQNNSIRPGASSSKSLFSTGLGQGYKISEESISKSKALFDPNKKAAETAPSSFFSTGRGGKVNIDANALEKSKGLFGNSDDFTTPNRSSIKSSHGFFATAKGGRVDIDAEALAKSKGLLQSSELKSQVNSLTGSNAVQSAITPARPVRPSAGSLNLKRKTAFPEQISALEETKKGRIEAEQQCIRLALRNNYSPFENFKIDKNDRLRSYQNHHEKEIFDLIMPRPHFDEDEKARLNEKLFHSLLQSSKQDEAIQEQN